MSERDSNLDGIRINAPLGLNQRAAPNALPPGEWDKLEGCYPARTGLLERIPGKDLLMKLNAPIWNIHQTNDGSGTILVQTSDALHRFTLDELLNRSPSAPSLTYTDGGGETPGEDTTEETMSMAILVQKEAANTPSGSLRGIQTGTDSTAVANTFYTRRLTHELVNESSTVQTSTLSGTTANINTGQWTLAEGSYRITAHATFCSTSSNAGFCLGLYNTTDAVFEVHTGTSVPIIGTVAHSAGDNSNMMSVIEASFDVTGGAKSFELRHKCSTQAEARALSACGRTDTMTTLNVNGAAAPQIYTYIKILKSA